MIYWVNPLTACLMLHLLHIFRLEEIMSSLVEEVPQSQTALRSMDWDFLANTNK